MVRKLEKNVKNTRCKVETGGEIGSQQNHGGLSALLKFSTTTTKNTKFVIMANSNQKYSDTGKKYFQV